MFRGIQCRRPRASRRLRSAIPATRLISSALNGSRAARISNGKKCNENLLEIRTTNFEPLRPRDSAARFRNYANRDELRDALAKAARLRYSDALFPLTPALSLREREHHRPRVQQLALVGIFASRQDVPHSAFHAPRSTLDALLRLHDDRDRHMPGGDWVCTRCDHRRVAIGNECATGESH